MQACSYSHNAFYYRYIRDEYINNSTLFFYIFRKYSWCIDNILDAVDDVSIYLRFSLCNNVLLTYQWCSSKDFKIFLNLVWIDNNWCLVRFISYTEPNLKMYQKWYCLLFYYRPYYVCVVCVLNKLCSILLRSPL